MLTAVSLFEPLSSANSAIVEVPQEYQVLKQRQSPGLESVHPTDLKGLASVIARTVTELFS